jgi:hypothetical protein
MFTVNNPKDGTCSYIGYLCKYGNYTHGCLETLAGPSSNHSIPIDFNLGTLLTIKHPLEILTTPTMVMSFTMQHLSFFTLPYNIATLNNASMPAYGGERSYYNCMIQDPSNT